MTSGDSEEAELMWVLGSGTSTPGNHDFTLDRPVSDDEREQLLGASGFIRTMGSGFGFNQVIVAVRDFFDRAQRILEKGEASNNDLFQIERSFLVAAQLVAGTPSRIESSLKDFELS